MAHLDWRQLLTSWFRFIMPSLGLFASDDVQLCTVNLVLFSFLLFLWNNFFCKETFVKKMYICEVEEKGNLFCLSFQNHDKVIWWSTIRVCTLSETIWIPEKTLAFCSFFSLIVGFSELCDVTTNTVITYSKLPRAAVDERRMPLGSFDHLLQQSRNQPKPNPTQPLVAQLQPPMLPPPLHPKLKLAFSSQMLDTTVQYMQSERQPHLSLGSTLSKSEESDWTFSAGKNTEKLLSQPDSKLPVHRGFAFLKSEVFTVGATQSFKAEIMIDKSGSVTKSIPQSERYQTESQPLLTKKWETQSSSTLSEPQQTSTQRVFPLFNKDPSKFQNDLPHTRLSLATETQPSVIRSEQSPTQPEDYLTTFTLPKIQTHASPAQPPQTQEPLLHNVTAPVPHSSLVTQSPVTPFSTSSWSSKPPTLNHDGQFNISQPGGSVKPASGQDWQKSNTSQSPMTSNDPRSVK